MTTRNPDGETTVAALLALLDAAAAIIRLPADVRRQTIGVKTVQFLLEDAKTLDRALDADLREETRINPPSESASIRANPRPDEPTAQNAPTRPRAASRPPKTPAPQRTPVLPPVFPATTNGNSNGHATEPEPTHGKPEDTPTDANDHPHPSNRLPFAEFDRLVRAEMKRLSMDGRLPGHKLWNNERNPHLPTLAAVILRYKADGLVGLAEMLGLEAPLSVQQKGAPTP